MGSGGTFFNSFDVTGSATEVVILDDDNAPFRYTYSITPLELGMFTIHYELSQEYPANYTNCLDCETHWTFTFIVTDATLTPSLCAPAHINLCGPYDPAPLETLMVCPNSTFCLQTVGHLPEDAEEFQWFWLDVVPGATVGMPSFVGSDIGTQVTIQAPSAGWFTVWGSGPPLTVLVGAVDLDIDSDNNERFNHNFSRTPADELLEDQAGHPGKLIFVNKVDDDGDRVPGFADGLAEK